MRAGATFVAAIAALLVWGSGLDRASASAPGFAAWVPEFLRSAAWRAHSAVALARNDVTAAQAAGLRAVRADPADAASASALGTARLAAGDAARAERAFRVAAELGWRDPATQLYWMAVSLEAGDLDLASQRLDALLRQRPMLATNPALFAPFNATPMGRKRVSERLALRPSWLERYTGLVDALPPDELLTRAQVLEQPEIAPAAVRCADLEALIRALLAANKLDQARRLHESRCGALPPYIADRGFEQAALNGSSPFGWNFPGEAGVDTRIERRKRGAQAILVASTLASSSVFTAQALRGGGGAYRISWSALDASGQSIGRIAARVACAQGAPAASDPATLARDGRFSAKIVVPPVCAAPRLELLIVPGEGTVAVDDVEVERPR